MRWDKVLVGKKINSYDEDIEIDFGENALEAYYAHARVSNGKLNIVIAIRHLATAETVSLELNSIIGRLTLPSAILDKLSPGYANVLSRNNIQLLTYVANDSAQLSFLFDKTATGINITMGQGITFAFTSSNYIGRLEVNFTL